jgi:hybrid cluster-associated redox disulfide protein
MTKEITADMKIKEIISKYPETARIFYKHRMDCLTCSGADMETLKLGALYHGKKHEELLKELNEAIRNSRKKK